MLKNKIYIASDHAGYALKEKICAFFKAENFKYEDLGTDSEASCDYPDYAHLLASNMDTQSFGVLICGSGIGVSMAANRHKNIRCALCSESLSAKLAREHNDANVLAIGARLIGIDMAIEMIKTFVNTEFNGGRHSKRVEKIEVQPC